MGAPAGLQVYAEIFGQTSSILLENRAHDLAAHSHRTALTERKKGGNQHVSSMTCPPARIVPVRELTGRVSLPHRVRRHPLSSRPYYHWLARKSVPYSVDRTRGCRPKRFVAAAREITTLSGIQESSARPRIAPCTSCRAADERIAVERTTETAVCGWQRVAGRHVFGPHQVGSGRGIARAKPALMVSLEATGSLMQGPGERRFERSHGITSWHGLQPEPRGEADDVPWQAVARSPLPGGPLHARRMGHAVAACSGPVRHGARRRMGIFGPSDGPPGQRALSVLRRPTSTRAVKILASTSAAADI